jgi:hypothetical protein
MPVADPEIFSDVQRMAQLQVIADRASQMPEIYNQKAVEQRILERTKIPNADELLLPDDTPEQQNAVNENASMSMGRPVAAFPDQDHLAHLQVHLDYTMSPVLGQFPLIAQTYLPLVMQHVTEHMALYYVQYNVELLQASTGMDDNELSEMLRLQDPEVRKQMDRNLALQSQDVVPAVGKVFASIPQIMQQISQVLQDMQPEPEQPPADPNAMAAIEQERESDEMRDAREREKTQLTLVDKKDAREHQTETKFMELDAQEKQKALDSARDDARQADEYAARLEELLVREAGEDERTEVEVESREAINADDNRTALEIADVQAEAKEKSGVTTGEGVTNPRPRTDT